MPQYVSQAAGKSNAGLIVDLRLIDICELILYRSSIVIIFWVSRLNWLNEA